MCYNINMMRKRIISLVQSVSSDGKSKHFATLPVARFFFMYHSAETDCVSKSTQGWINKRRCNYKATSQATNPFEHTDPSKKQGSLKPVLNRQQLNTKRTASLNKRLDKQEFGR